MYAACEIIHAATLPVRTLVKKLRRNLGDDTAKPVYVLTVRASATAFADPTSGEGDPSLTTLESTRR